MRGLLNSLKAVRKEASAPKQRSFEGELLSLSESIFMRYILLMPFRLHAARVESPHSQVRYANPEIEADRFAFVKAFPLHPNGPKAM